MNKRSSPHKRLSTQFLDRWSPRAFLPDSLSDDEIATLFEAARWSPSCYNEQPWRFVFARTENDRNNFLSTFVKANQSWTDKAPLLVLVIASNRFSKNDQPNRWAEFDTGTAWMSLAIQAENLGLACHAMGGFDAEKSLSLWQADPEKHTALCMVAIGRQAPASMLEATLAERELPSDRQPQSFFVFESKLATEEK